MTALVSIATKPRVATYHHVPTDPERAKDCREKLEAFAKTFGPIIVRYDVQTRTYEQKIRTLLARAQTNAFEVLAVLAVGALGTSRMGAMKAVQKLDATGVTARSFSEPWFNVKDPWVE